MLASFTILAWIPGPPELIVIAVIALVIFGRRLPDVARSMGKSIVEFKKGLKDVKEDIDSAASQDDVQKALPSEKDARKEPDKDSGKESEKQPVGGSGRESDKGSDKESVRDSANSSS